MPKLFVGGIPYRFDEKPLWEIFAAFGGLNCVSIITDRETKRSRRFAFVSISRTGAALALEVLNGGELGDG
jgi:cold-inducible RNA-binding protein